MFNMGQPRLPREITQETNSTLKANEQPRRRNKQPKPPSRAELAELLKELPRAAMGSLPGLTLLRRSKSSLRALRRAQNALKKTTGNPERQKLDPCKPESWLHIRCSSGCFESWVPESSCGDSDCPTCSPKVVRRRKKRALKRFDGASLGTLTLTYPDYIAKRIDQPTLRALMPLAARAVDTWLRIVHHIGPELEVGIEDWFHPTGEDMNDWHPHHNFLIRLQALGIKGGDLYRRKLRPWVSKSDLELLKSIWRAILNEVVKPAGLTEVKTVNAWYGFVRENEQQKKSHRLKYFCRPFPGWHGQALGKTQRRAYGYFRRGWPLYREMLGVGNLKPQVNCIRCDSHILKDVVDGEGVLAHLDSEVRRRRYRTQHREKRLLGDKGANFDNRFSSADTCLSGHPVTTNP
jgi:hypothetical protein